MRKIIGWTLAVISISAVILVVYLVGILSVFLFSMGTTIIIIGLVWLIVWLIIG